MVRLVDIEREKMRRCKRLEICMRPFVFSFHEDLPAEFSDTLIEQAWQVWQAAIEMEFLCRKAELMHPIIRLLLEINRMSVSYMKVAS